MNMYKCSQGTQEEDNEGILWPEQKMDEGKRSRDFPQNLPHQQSVPCNKSENSSQGVFGGNSDVHFLQVSSGTLPVTHQGQSGHVVGHSDEVKLQPLLTHQEEMYTHISAQSHIPQLSTNTAGVKLKHLHINAVDCAEHAQTVQSYTVLTNPAAVKTSSKDVNRGTRTKVFLNQNHSTYPTDKNSSPTPSPRRAVDGKNSAQESPKSSSRLPSNSLNQPLLPSSQERTPTKTFMYLKPKPSPSPSKSEKSTVESDIEDFNSDTSFDDVDFDITLPDPVSTKSVKSTVESDIDNFNSDTTFDGLNVDVVAMTPGPSRAPSSQVDSNLEAFDNDSFFDNIDPEMLSANSESIPSLPSSQTEHNPRNTFDLLGEGFDDEETVAPGFAQLPLEVLQRIFCFVPLVDLCRHLSCVCKLWNEIISKEEFIPWKKTYHRVRQKVYIFDLSDQENLLTKQGNASGSESSFMLDLVRSMPKFQARCGTSMDQDLQKHPKYDLARDIIKDRAPDVLQCDTPNPWSTIALLVILSETVHDVFAILRCLLYPTATCTTMELLECLYCIASHLWIYKKLYSHNIGLHYRVYYTLYLFENSQSPIYLTPDGSSRDDRRVGPGSIRNQRVLFTYEQSRIINHDLERGQVLKVQAFAGTGKTTTLVKYAEQRPHMTFLYVALNKSVQKHAEEIFPRNVTSSTLHSLAYKAIGWKYKDKVVSGLKPSKMHKLISARNPGMQYPIEIQWLCYSKLVCKTLNNYCASADEVLTSRHVPGVYLIYEQTCHGLRAYKPQIGGSARMHIARAAIGVWKGMRNLNDHETVITHDVYLKLYQLSKPWNLKYDCLLIDEAQDMTPAQQDILMNQPGAKILVGDDHQQIYSFRGATNAMTRVVSQHTFHLTQSFRFGPGIAYIADCLLERSSQKVRHILVGKMQQDHIDGEELGQIAIITQTSVTVFREAVKIVEADTTTMIAFVGGIEGYGMDMILDIHQLQLPQSARGVIKNQLVNYHARISSLKAYANKAENVELLNKILIVEQYKIRIPRLVKLIQSRTGPESSAAFVLSTVHKSKGLEFDTVKITDDFAINADRLNAYGTIESDELNMIYVAVTRAKKSLVLNSSFLKFLSQQPIKEKFMYPVSAKPSGDAELNVCVGCKKMIPQDAVVLLKIKDFQLAFPTCRRGGVGVLCPQCSLKSYPSFQCFYNFDDQDHSLRGTIR